MVKIKFLIYLSCVLFLGGCVFSIGPHVRMYTGTADFNTFPATRYFSKTEWNNEFFYAQNFNPELNVFHLLYWLNWLGDIAFWPIDAAGYTLLKPDEMSVDELGRIVMPRRWGELSEVCPHELDDAILLKIEPESGNLLFFVKSLGLYTREMMWVINANGVFESNITGMTDNGIEMMWDRISKRSGNKSISIWLSPPSLRFSFREYCLSVGDKGRVFTASHIRSPEGIGSVHFMSRIHGSSEKGAVLDIGMDKRYENFVGKITANRQSGEVMCVWTFLKDCVIISRDGKEEIKRPRQPWIECDLIKELNNLSGSDGRFFVPHVPHIKDDKERVNREVERFRKANERIPFY